MFWCLLLFVVGRVLGQMDCDREAQQDLAENFRHCTTEHKNKYAEDLEEGDSDREVEVATCKLVTELVVTCGELWGLCHSREEVVRIKDMQLQSLLDKNQDSGVDLEQCPIIQKFREIHSIKNQKRCSEEEKERGRNRFQICSHNTSTAVYSEVETLTNKGLIMDSLCYALGRLTTTCFSHLAKCLSGPDLREMHRLHMVDVVEHMLNLVGGQVEREELQACQGTVKEDGEEYYDSEYYYDDDIVTEIIPNLQTDTPSDSEESQGVKESTPSLRLNISAQVRSHNPPNIRETGGRTVHSSSPAFFASAISLIGVTLLNFIKMMSL